MTKYLLALAALLCVLAITSFMIALGVACYNMGAKITTTLPSVMNTIGWCLLAAAIATNVIATRSAT